MTGGRERAIGLALACAVLLTPAARAQDNPLAGIFKAIVNAAVVDSAVKSWQAVGQDVQQCMINRYGIGPREMAEQGIHATDPQVAPYVRSCQVEVAQAQERANAAAGAMRLWQALDPNLLQCLRGRYGIVPKPLADQGIRPGDPQVRPALTACQQAQEQAEAEAKAVYERDQAAKAKAVARHQRLIERFGADQAAAIEAGAIRVGMSKAAVLEARGQPDRKEVIPPSDELWIYGQERVAISNGRVTYVGR